MEALLVSTLVVALAEIGDRTQLLSLFLACRFKKPTQVLLGILVATLANHLLAGLAGKWIGEAIDPATLRWALGASFLVMAAWVLLPEKASPSKTSKIARGGAFAATLFSFFLAEMGDKTQIATAALAARFDDLAMVVIGTSTGMMIANLPVVLFGHLAGHRIDPRWTRWIAAAVLAVQGILVLSGVRFF